VSTPDRVSESFSPVRLSSREFSLFRDLIYQETGINLRTAKQQMLSARLSRRLRALELDSFSDYFDLVTRSDSGNREKREMINAVTTNLTAFFREPAHFHFLRKWLEERRTQQRRFRVWCAASSTGQEPYTLAMTFHEAFPGQMAGYDVRILATDIDTEVLETARNGVYRTSDVEKLTAERQSRFFLRGKHGSSGLVRVKPELSRLVLFRPLNLIAPAWPMRGPFDAIFCRNVLIYFDESTQRAVIGRMLDLIRPGGLLFVGHSESLHWSKGMLRMLAHAVYEVPCGR
jgi:chemotaxis protein methyltransferase CheR